MEVGDRRNNNDIDRAMLIRFSIQLDNSTTVLPSTLISVTLPRSPGYPHRMQHFIDRFYKSQLVEKIHETCTCNQLLTTSWKYNVKIKLRYKIIKVKTYRHSIQTYIDFSFQFLLKICKNAQNSNFRYFPDN